MTSEERSSNATQYNSLSTPQFNVGCSFAGLLNLKPGYKVLDMGCGTGGLTRFLAEQVGEIGEVVGVDPDEERIKIAGDNLADIQNVTVQVGDNVSGFPHENEAYYDLHFSNMVLHWLSLDERKMYVKKAFDCLKPQGLLAIQSVAKIGDDVIGERVMESYNSTDPKITFVEEQDMKVLLTSCKFTDVEVKLIIGAYYFDSYDHVVACWSAGCYSDLNQLPDKQALEDFKKSIKQPDGRFKMKYKMIQVKGRKAVVNTN